MRAPNVVLANFLELFLVINVLAYKSSYFMLIMHYSALEV